MSFENAAQCTAKSKSTGQRCKNPAVNGTTVCRMHGGTGVRHGADNGNFKHGRYSKVARGKIAERLAELDDNNPLDLLDELQIQRALFAEYISRFEAGTPLKAGDIGMLMGWSSEITRTVERIVKMRNETALTGAEVKYLAVRAAELVVEFIPDADRQTAFIHALFGGLSESNPRAPVFASDEDE